MKTEKKSIIFVPKKTIKQEASKKNGKNQIKSPKQQ
jgi:hypothetical protein